MDGHVYDACTLLDDAQIETVMGGQTYPGQGLSLAEFTRASGIEAERDRPEGAVTCRWTGKANDMLTVELNVWSDDSLQHSLSDPAMTAAAWFERLKASRWPGPDSFSTFEPVDEPGLADAAFRSEAHQNASKNAAITVLSGSLILELVYVDMMAEPCFDAACIEAVVDTLRPLLSSELGGIVEALTSGKGAVAEWPEITPLDTPLTVETASGETVDLCGAFEAAITAAMPGTAFEPVRRGQATTYMFDTDNLEPTACAISPLDSTLAPSLYLAALDVNDPDLSAAYDAQRANGSTGEIPSGFGYDAYLFGNLVMRVNGVVLVFGASSFLEGQPELPAVFAAATSVATALQA